MQNPKDWNMSKGTVVQKLSVKTLPQWCVKV